MTYEQFQRQCASYGFTYTPLTQDEHTTLRTLGYDDDEIYGIACDANAGYTIQESLEAMESNNV